MSGSLSQIGVFLFLQRPRRHTRIRHFLAQFISKFTLSLLVLHNYGPTSTMRVNVFLFSPIFSPLNRYLPPSEKNIDLKF